LGAAILLSANISPVWSLASRTVTIGICVRNCEEFIEEAIQSIVEQDYPHSLMELIFVDGNSTDETLSIVKRLTANIGIRAKILSDSGGGLGVARNMVVFNAIGDFILWVDGDMVLSRDYVTKLVEFIEKNPKVGIAKGMQSLNCGDDIVGSLEGYARVLGHMVNYRSMKGKLKSLGTSGCIYRIKPLREIGGFDCDMRGYGEDQDIEIRMRSRGWELDTVAVEYQDYERHGVKWKQLWRRYWLRGYYSHCLFSKHPGMLKHSRMSPPAAFFLGAVQSLKLYKLTLRKKVFILPLHYFFKMTGWYLGYVHSHLNSYEPSNNFYFGKSCHPGRN
jgi:glycosyltransferase involved in cell wall biosynthesis